MKNIRDLGFFRGLCRGCLYSFFIYGARLAVDIALLMLTRGKDEKVMNNMLRERDGARWTFLYTIF